ATAVGVSKFDTDVVGAGLDVTDETAMGFQLDLGYHFNPQLGVQLALTELGDAGVGTGWVSYSSKALLLQYRPEMLAYGKWQTQARFGVNYMEYTGHKGLNIDEESATVAMWSLGADYPLNEQGGFVELMFSAFADDVNFYSVGFRQTF
ncbi:MAG: hypothetical protein VW274_03090, partial [Thalassolituus sp.]